MKHLCILTEQDLRLAESIYLKLREESNAMIFLYDHSEFSFYIFGGCALLLEDIINELDVSTIYKQSTFDNKPYYKIQRCRLTFLVYELVARDIEIRLI